MCWGTQAGLSSGAICQQETSERLALRSGEYSNLTPLSVRRGGQRRLASALALWPPRRLAVSPIQIGQSGQRVTPRPALLLRPASAYHSCCRPAEQRRVCSTFGWIARPFHAKWALLCNSLNSALQRGCEIPPRTGIVLFPGDSLRRACCHLARY